MQWRDPFHAVSIFERKETLKDLENGFGAIHCIDWELKSLIVSRKKNKRTEIIAHLT
jgi:hypothetical protein